MGDESESDAEPTEQPDVSAESDETATPSTDESSEPVDDTPSDDPGDDAVSEPPLQPEAAGDASVAGGDEGTLEPVVTERNGDADDVDVSDTAGDGEDDADVSDTAGDDEDDRDDGDDGDETEPFDPADSPALQASENADEAFAEPAPAPEIDEDEALPGAFGQIDEDDVSSAGTAEADEFSTADGFDEGLVGEGPESDQEMPLADHIEEMVRRLAVVFVIGGGVALSVFGLGEVLQYIPSTIDIINFLWNKHIPGAGLPGNEDLRPHIYGPLELILTKLKVAGLVGVVVGLPVFVYQSYLFMKPGLYQNERKYYLASVPTSLILAVVGVAFAHFVVLPSIFAYFTSYTEGTAIIAFGLSETFNLILILMGYMAIVFQIPLFIMLAIMMNLVTRQWLEDKRLLFWGAFLGLAFLVSPDPTGMAPIIIAITMVALFEGTLLLLRWTGN